MGGIVVAILPPAGVVGFPPAGVVGVLVAGVVGVFVGAVVVMVVAGAVVGGGTTNPVVDTKVVPVIISYNIPVVS